MSAPPPGPKFSLQRIYVKDISFESPRAPGGFRGPWQPKIDLELNSRHNDLGAKPDEGQDKDPGGASGGGKRHEVVLSLRVTAKNEADEVLYLIEVSQAGLFLIRDLEGEALARLLAGTCPGILFPYVRELVDSILTRGNFPPLMLEPVDFEALREHAILLESKRQSEQDQALKIH